MDTTVFVGPTFALRVPAEWIVGASSQFQAIFRSVTSDNGVHPNLVIAIRTLEEGASLKEILSVARETQEKEYPGYKKISESPIIIGAAGGARRTYEWQLPERGLSVRQQQASFLDGRNLYTLTATRAADSKNAAEIDQLFDQILGSFEFRAPQPAA